MNDEIIHLVTLISFECTVENLLTYHVKPTAAVLCIHGFNLSFEAGFTTFAQALALAHLPSNVVPFYFSWPAGALGSYPQSAKMASNRRSMRCSSLLL